VLNSPYNLITDVSIKKQIINVLSELREDNLSERMLKAYLYLIIGNVTRSDNLLKSFINQHPVKSWAGYSSERSMFSQLAEENIDQILLKLSRHPSDRKTYYLFTEYVLSFYTDTGLIEEIKKNSGTDYSDKLKLSFMERISKWTVNYLVLSKNSVSRRVKRLRDGGRFPFEEQAYWIWPFLEIDPLISEQLFSTLSLIEKNDQLWFLYLMSDEKMADMYVKKGGKIFLPSRRHYLQGFLDSNQTFMLSLYKIIEIGDIGPELVKKVTDHLTRD